MRPAPRRRRSSTVLAAGALGVLLGPAPAAAQRVLLPPPDSVVAPAAAARAGGDEVRPRAPERPRVGPRFADPALAESSGLAPSGWLPGVFWTVNDSGGEAALFAVRAADGRTVGRVRVAGARNVDWEALAAGPCGAAEAQGPAAPPPNAAGRCLYVADVGDNAAARPDVTLYRVPEPRPRSGARGGVRFPAATAPAAALRVRYADGPRDVEAAAVLPDGDVWLVTKAPARRADGTLRPALVYRVPAAAWAAGDGLATARLVDSLPVVPDGTITHRVTDAAFDAGRGLLAARTYDAVYLVPVAGPPWRVDRRRRAAACDLVVLREPQGEGVAFAGGRGAAARGAAALAVSSESNFLGPGGLASLACPAPE